MGKPNLFEYATSELSQDAFFCWLLDWLNDPNQLVAEASWRLFEQVFGSRGLAVQRDGIAAVHIRRQFHGVDIVVVFELVSQPKICLVIEDKVDALLTGNDQLVRNIENTATHADEWPPLCGVERDRIMGLLLKTGYDFDFRCPPSYTMLTHLDFKDWVEGLLARSLEVSDILTNWAEWCYRGYRESEEKVLAATVHVGDIASGKWVDNKLWDSQWANPIYQYNLFKRLFHVELGDIVEVKEDDGYRTVYFHPFYNRARKEYLLQGTSRGRWWIQYHFDAPGADDFFYRLDWQAGMWGISLRFYKKDKSADDLRRMQDVAATLEALLKARGLVTSRFRSSSARIETTCLLIDPYRSPGLLEMAGVHADFVGAKFAV
ncbi:MAG: hypothetical protein KGL31_12930 [candidate division NC10 bacterium]|nr:hypothetical protein [candidate division NC10 bacterium]MDE2322792.1 hypothetical protein [candidate division NC10 bacterium]